jgi:hypothetical protein
MLYLVRPGTFESFVVKKGTRGKQPKRSLKSKSPAYIRFQLILMTKFYRGVYHEDWRKKNPNEKKEFGGHWKNVSKDERKVSRIVF